MKLWPKRRKKPITIVIPKDPWIRLVIDGEVILDPAKTKEDT